MKRAFLSTIRLFSIIGILITGQLDKTAEAVTIVDTGPGPGGAAGSVGGFVLGNPGVNQFLAAEFSFTTGFAITDVQGWIDPFAGGTATAVLYTDGGEVPGTELFSQTFSATGSVVGWFGPSGLSWNLATGIYWVAFEVRSGDTLNAAMPFPSTSPLGNEAVQNDSTSGIYMDAGNLSIGVRICTGNEGCPATVPTVPEPSTLLLLASGLLGLAGLARRRMT